MNPKPHTIRTKPPPPLKSKRQSVPQSRRPVGGEPAVKGIQSSVGNSATPKRFPVVGIGASTGGLDAFTQLLQNLATDTGMAFVFVQHLDPDHQSALTYLLARATSMLVTEVTHGLAVEPNWIYVIPPNANMIISAGVLKLQPRQKTAGAHRSIDFFFESLSQDQKEMAIGVVLSGTANDGTQGLEMIKSEGGFSRFWFELRKSNQV